MIIPTRLFAEGQRAASVGAIALISMLAFEAIAIATAMPAVARALGGLPLYALAFGATLATSVVGMVLAGEWCDKRGAFQATLTGLATFLAGLLVAGFAPSMAVLVLGRALQGLGSGVLGVALDVGVGQLTPPALHSRMFALFAAAWVVPGLVGPARIHDAAPRRTVFGAGFVLCVAGLAGVATPLLGGVPAAVAVLLLSAGLAALAAWISPRADPSPGGRGVPQPSAGA